jgi:hypothetical protein
MAQRGCKSAASLSIVSVLANERPAPPDELTEFSAGGVAADCRERGVDVACQRAISLSATTP